MRKAKISHWFPRRFMVCQLLLVMVVLIQQFSTSPLQLDHQQQHSILPYNKRVLHERYGGGEVVVQATRNRTYAACKKTLNRFKSQCQQGPCLVHLHIAKSGGTSLDKVLAEAAEETGRSYCGKRHFDWSLIKDLVPKEHVVVVTMLRHPVSRAVSHFYFQQVQSGGMSMEFKEASLDAFLQDKTMMLRDRRVWHDGQASVSWLTGTHVAGWVGCPHDDVEQREQRAITNISDLLHMAADRLEDTLWFGILEDLDRSMELLQYVLHLSAQPVLPRENTRKTSHPKPTNEQLGAIESLVPQDLWLYKYGLLLFEARWHAYTTGQPVQLPPRPPIPTILSCLSTRFALNCTSGPYKGDFSITS